MRDFTKIRVWESAHALALEIRKVTNEYPLHERFELASQTWRAALSIPANIAEGAGASSRKDFRRFLGITSASSNELEYHVIVARDLGYLPRPEARDLRTAVRSVRRQLTSFTDTIV